MTRHCLLIGESVITKLSLVCDILLMNTLPEKLLKTRNLHLDLVKMAHLTQEERKFIGKAYHSYLREHGSFKN
jgi:hypothetical protein